MKVGDYVHFFYKEMNQKGKIEINEYYGYIKAIFGGKFIIVGTNDSSPTRFERLAIHSMLQEF